MTVLRSREILPPKSSTTKTVKELVNIEPATPTQTHEPDTRQSPPALTPNPEIVGSGSDSGSVSGAARRRSLRIASKSVSGERKSVEKMDGSVLVQEEKQETGFDSIDNGVRVLKDNQGIEEQNNMNNETKGKRRKLNVDANLMNVSGSEDGGDKGYLGLRSGKRIAKRRVENDGDTANEREKEGRGKEGERMLVDWSGEVIVGRLEKDLGVDANGSVKREERCGRGGNGKAKLVKEALVLNGVDAVKLGFEFEAKKLIGNTGKNDGIKSIHERQGNGDDRKGKRILSDSGEGGVVIEKLGKNPSDSRTRTEEDGRRFSREEKGKGKLVDDALLSNVNDRVELGLECQVDNPVDNVVPDAIHSAENVVLQAERQVKKTTTRGNESRMEQFRDIARRKAPRFARFNPQEEEENHLPVEAETEMPSAEVDQEIEDWPGPFSTAMKIIKDRANKLNVQRGTSSSAKRKCSPVSWFPRKDQNRGLLKPIVPSLQELSMKILVQNADAITSLDNVPDALRHRLSQMLCDSRKMNSHFLDLLVRGSPPTEIRLRDCSWLTEEQFTKCFKGCDLNNLTVLQLDQCGRCLPDYILLSTLSRSTNSLPALTTLSLNGACRLSDVGLSALVSSAPALRSLNLSQCSLLTSTSIDTLADSLGSVLRELYINDCQSIDAMLILPALKKLEHLEVLSLAGIETVCDDFVREFIIACGHNMKELAFADCIKLTDSSLKVIAENCSGLYALDLVNLCKLTDSALGYLANGCQAIQTLKLRRNAFSDEAIAAFLETSGEFLIDLSLNNVKKVGHNTALSLARRSRKLQSLDLSWCRSLADEAVGLIVDSCLSLRVLKLFGCSQISNAFLDGHSNPEVKIIGLKMSPVLEHLKVPDPQEGPLHYSAVHSSM